MPTIVLVGFSCSGKSKIAELARKRWGSEVTTLDSDDWVASKHQDNILGKHIYGLFLKLGRDEALAEIERLERRFLDLQEPTDDAVLIAAGPWMVIPERNPELAAFRTRVSPSFVYLEVTPDVALRRLVGRRRKQEKKERVASHANFRSWDEAVTSTRKGFRWVDIPENQALQNVTGLICALDPIYRSLAPEANRFPAAHSEDGTKAVLDRVGELLNLSL